MLHARPNFLVSVLLPFLLLLHVAAQAAYIEFVPVLNTQTFESQTALKTGSTDVIAVGEHTNGTLGPIRNFHRYDLSTLPKHATITDAAFTFHTGSNQPTMPATIEFVELDTVLEMNTSVTWYTIDGVNSWTTGGGDVGSHLATLSPTAWQDNTEYTFAPTGDFVTRLQNAFDNQSGLFQAMLYAPDHEASEDRGFIRYYARNTPTPPSLSVTYESSSVAIRTIGVDYHSSGPQQDGFTLAGPISSNVSTTTLHNAFAPGDTVTAALTSPNGSITDRTRTTVVGTPLTNLVSDLTFANTGDLELILSGLPAGECAFEGWFNDSYSPGPTTLNGTYEAYVDGVLVDTFESTNTQDASTGLGKSEFNFLATAGNDVVIFFTNIDDIHTMINGWRLTEVIPEPASLTLLLTLMFALLLRRNTA